MFTIKQHEDLEQRYGFEDGELDTMGGVLEYPKANHDYDNT